MFLRISVLLLFGGYNTYLADSGNHYIQNLYNEGTNSNWAVNITACANTTADLKLELVCGRKMVAVAETVQGAKLSHRNICMHDEHDKLYKPLNFNSYVIGCLWKKSRCYFNDTKMKNEFFLQVPERANYMIAQNFQCIEKKRIIDICSEKQRFKPVQLNYGYIISPDFPKHYQKYDKPCHKVISNYGSYANILLSFKTMDIQNSQPCNEVSQEYIRIKYKTFTGKEKLRYLCPDKKYVYPLNIEILAYDVEIMFQRYGTAPNTGFRLDFKVENISEPTAGTMTQDITETTQDLHITPSQYYLTSAHVRRKGFKFQAIHYVFIIVLSVLILCVSITVIIIIVQCIKHFKDKKRKQPEIINYNKDKNYNIEELIPEPYMHKPTCIEATPLRRGENFRECTNYEDDLRSICTIQRGEL